MKTNILLKCLLVGVVTSVSALADMTVDKSNGVLTITSNISGTVIAKIVGPNDKIVINEKYEGNSFSWTPSGMDGAYRYDIRVVPVMEKTNSTDKTQRGRGKMLSIKSYYAGGSIEIYEGSIKEEKKLKLIRKREVSK